MSLAPHLNLCLPPSLKNHPKNNPTFLHNRVWLWLGVVGVMNRFRPCFCQHYFPTSYMHRIRVSVRQRRIIININNLGLDLTRSLKTLWPRLFQNWSKQNQIAPKFEWNLTQPQTHQAQVQTLQEPEGFRNYGKRG